MNVRFGIMHFLLAAVFIASASALHAQNDKISSWQAEADSLMQQEQFEEALKLYDRIVSNTKEGDPRAEEATYKRAVCLYSLGNLNDALHAVNQFIEHSPTFRQAKLLRAFIYRDLDNTQGQLRDINDLLAMSPLNTDLIKWKSYLLIQKEEYDSAKAQLQYASLLQNDAEIELYLGMAYYYTDDADSALIHFDKAIDMKPDFLSALLYGASICLEQDAYELALIYLDKASLLDPDNLSVLFYKGIALTESGRSEEGCRYLSRAFYGGEDDAAGYLEQNCFRYNPDQ